MKNEKSIGYWSVVAIGIGGMVGGGIFAVLGLAVELARGGTAIAFAIAGIVALITSYSYAKLSVAYPSQGGTVEFLNKAFGKGVFTGGFNILLWLSYIVMLALYAYAFGSYGASFFPKSTQTFWKHLLISLIIISITWLNALSVGTIGKTERWIVAFKVAILLFFIGVGFWSINASRFGPTTWTSPVKLVAGGMIIFLAYEGFELIANTAKDVKNPRKTLPRAYYTAVTFVILLYILVALVTVGSLPISQIVGARDYALAEAAKPSMGSFGFTLIAIAALLSTASAINATFYGASRVSYNIAKDGELPELLEKKVWNKPIEGLLITSVFTLFIANFSNLSTISTMGSAGFLVIFAAVNAANARMHKGTESRRWISVFGIFACLGALVTLIWQTLTTNPKEILILIIMLVLAFAIEVVYRNRTGRIILPLSPRTIHTEERR